MMNDSIQSPNPEKVKQTAAKLRDICTMFDAQILVLDELIAQEVNILLPFLVEFVPLVLNTVFPVHHTNITIRG